MNTTSSSRSVIVAVLPLAALLGGCSSSPAATLREPACATTPHAPPVPGIEGVHAVRIPLRSRDALQVSDVLRDLLDVPRDRDVRAILDEPSTDSVVVIGTDAGVARVRALLSPALIGDADAGVAHAGPTD